MVRQRHKESHRSRSKNGVFVLIRSKLVHILEVSTEKDINTFKCPSLGGIMLSQRHNKSHRSRA